MKSDGAWHLDKRLPLGLIIGLAINMICGIWYASKLDSRVGVLEQHETVMMADTIKLKEIQDSNRERLIKMETQLESILDALRVVQNRMPVSRRKTDYIP